MKNKNIKIEKLIRKKIETTMIGALARFEDGFGHLWGQDRDNPTQEQERNFLIWEDIRSKILDHGNDQIRRALSEINNNDNCQVKYSYYYKFNTRRENNEN